MRDYIFNGAALAVLIAAILTTLCSLLCAPILHLLSVPSDIFADAYAYQLVIFLGIPFSILYNYLSSILSQSAVFLCRKQELYLTGNKKQT